MAMAMANGDWQPAQHNKKAAPILTKLASSTQLNAVSFEAEL